MLENDNLQNAEGKKEVEETNVETTPNTSVQETTPETVIENKTTADESSTKQEETHVEEIDNSNAEDAEDEDNQERHKLEDKDYHSMSMEALVTEFESLLKNHKIQTISSHVNDIKTEFKSKYEVLLDEKKAEFEEDGGNPIDFYYSNDTKKRFNAASKEYKQAINAYYKDREKSLKDNLANRLEIIENIKELVGVEENMGETYKQFKELQDKWRNAGPIPRDKYNNAWNTYHHHVERFYDFLHLNRDLRDMDFKHNYDQKLKIIQRAEELAANHNVNHSFRELQVLHKLWKEELGPVAKEHRDEIWERFSNATKIIHDKRQEYYADLDKAYEKNLVRKEEIIEKIKALNTEESTSHGVIQKRIKALEALREDFFNAGKVPLKQNEATWKKFKDAVREFNRSKNKFYKNLKKDQYENLQQKLELIKVAEDNKDSDDFKTVTPLMKKIQNEWKSIGHVPRKDSDKIWKQFKAACNHYFDRMHAERKAENQELYDAFDKKQELLNKVKAFKFSDDVKSDVAKLQDIIKTFKTVGHVPQNKRFIDGKFYKAVDNAFDAVKMEKSKLDMIRFEGRLDNLSAGDDTRQLDNEQNFIRKKIDEVKSEINQLENNLQFFSNVKSDNPLVKDVHKNIAKHKNDLETWKSKLKRVREMYSEE
ncbi:DUF349 domain-containing protein [Winogradskyella litorisediminis]|uniref:DUF349 domain-containing protein n=1 Tax=Winogradskyella litorisediminis TaxID=1156618 RepID=A0ABW3NAX8_9FLAO